MENLFQKQKVLKFGMLNCAYRTVHIFLVLLKSIGIYQLQVSMVLCKFEQGINIFLTDNLKTDALAGSEDQYKMHAKFVQI